MTYIWINNWLVKTMVTACINR